MKRYIIGLLMLLGSMAGFAQVVTGISESVGDSAEDAADAAATNTVGARARYGYCSRQQIMQAMPEYVKAQQQIKNLRDQYEKEAQYNEADFRRQFTEYLSGQKEFPQTILLKRQHDLQQAMEKGIAFREEAEALLKQAEADIMAPIRQRLDNAVSAVAAEKGYDYVVDTDLGAFIYLNPALSEDITPYVEAKLK